MRELNLPENLILANNQSYEAARTAVREKLAAGLAGIDAIACYNDDMAVSVLHALHEKGIDIPGRIAVIGCDNIPVAEHVWPSLSTIVHPWQEICVLGWQFQHNRIQNPDIPPQHTELSARFIPRDSTLGPHS
jgi:DNA-binding LacI/PurR family transcriptional regulator